MPWALLALAVVSTTGAHHATAAIDGFTYPGQSAEAARFNARWDAYMKRLPAAAAADPQMARLDWMVGSWTAQPREFPSSMRDPANAEPAPPAPATIDYIPGKRWLRISFVPEPWHVEWNYYLGHDPVSGGWVLNYLVSPSLIYDGPMTSRGWSGDRISFGPVRESFKGFRDVARLVLVRTSSDSFRIVSEVRMPSGQFVAMDDVLFTRR